MKHEIGHRNAGNIPRSERGGRGASLRDTAGRGHREVAYHFLVPSSTAAPSVPVEGDRLATFARFTLNRKRVPFDGSDSTFEPVAFVLTILISTFSQPVNALREMKFD